MISKNKAPKDQGLDDKDSFLLGGVEQGRISLEPALAAS